ncbi:MAG: twin-arginine translocation signal domain-containing protein [Deltaproteobacteria bacterium]|nr:twin-arginine translocation signal domain-containing protein [Deltaproteobacteria bacterium]
MPRPQRSAPHPGYPALSEVTCGRRQFLGRLAVGAAALGVGSRLLSACTSTRDISGNPNPGDLHEVRQPGEGYANVYLSSDEYVRFAVTFTTYNEAMAVYFRENEMEGVVAMTVAVQDLSCSTFHDHPATVKRILQDALEDHYLGLFDDTGSLIESLDLDVESCEVSVDIGGAAPYPGYP